MVNHAEFDNEIDVIALSFATRQLLSDLDRDLIVERALESLADFGSTDRIGLWLLDELGERVTAVGGLISGKPVIEETSPLPVSTPLAEMIGKRTLGTYPLTFQFDLPWPAEGGGVTGRQCLCAPLVAADNRFVGMVTFDHPEKFDMGIAKMQPLLVLLTVVAIGLELARLFKLAVIDGLTGLYVRRYMELRLAEEENRVRRHGGQLGVMITDIDHFKNFNDTYGHQQGDIVLRETAELMQKTVRIGLDLVCRYGGEEFVIIMPNTDVDGALVVAERIRDRCEKNPFSGQDKPLHVTLSGGLAIMDQQSPLPWAELLHRADEALYKAKEGGRNRVILWKS